MRNEELCNVLFQWKIRCEWKNARFLLCVYYVGPDIYGKKKENKQHRHERNKTQKERKLEGPMIFWNSYNAIHSFWMF